MNETNPVENLSKNIVKVKVGNEEFLLKPKPKDAAKLLLMSREDGFTSEILDVIADTVTNIVLRATPDANKEDIEGKVAFNFFPLFQEIMVMFGFMDREQLKKMESSKENALKKLASQ